MEIKEDCIISLAESYDGLEPSRRQRASNETVQDFLDRGLMNKDAVYERYLEKLLERWHIEDRGIRGVDALKQSFRRLRDPDTGYLSKDMFSNFMNEKWSGFGLAEPSEGLTSLFDIFSWHAFYPFPASLTDSGTPRIDEDAFPRAVCLLTWNPSPSWAPEFTRGALHSLSTGTWGPHRGSFVSKRGKDASDFLRRIFRSVAVPNSTITGIETTIPVPLFIYHEYHDEEDSGDEGQQFTIMENQNERKVDIQDTIAENPPDEIPKTANPLRQSYDPVVPTLPWHPFDLADLHVPITKIVALLNLLKAVRPREQGVVQDLIASAERLANEGELSWESFQAAMLNQAGFIANALQDIVLIFKVRRY